MKAVYKTNSTTLALLRETNLMRSLTARLEDSYCSITIVNHRLVTVIRFVAKVTLISKNILQINFIYYLMH